MLDGLKKKLGIVPNEQQPVEAVTDKLEVTLNVTETEEFKTLLSQFEEQTAQLQVAQDQISALQTSLEQFAEAKAQAEADAIKTKMEARMASLSKDVGDERAAKVLAATEGMDDASFEAIASALKMSAVEEAKSEMFTEQGVSAEAPATAQPAHFNTVIKNKQGKK